MIAESSRSSAADSGAEGQGVSWFAAQRLQARLSTEVTFGLQVMPKGRHTMTRFEDAVERTRFDHLVSPPGDRPGLSALTQNVSFRAARTSRATGARLDTSDVQALF
jgi:hypothetical protein